MLHAAVTKKISDIENEVFYTFVFGGVSKVRQTVGRWGTRLRRTTKCTFSFSQKWHTRENITQNAHCKYRLVLSLLLFIILIFTILGCAEIDCISIQEPLNPRTNHGKIRLSIDGQFWSLLLQWLYFPLRAHKFWNSQPISPSFFDLRSGEWSLQLIYNH
jgi:hypothetical protein